MSMSYLKRIEKGLLSRKKSVLEDKALFHSIRNLPTLPFVTTKVMETMNNPRSSASDLSKIISSDESLAAKVLRLVNSAYYGFPKPITTISHAVTILGFNTLRTIVVGISVSGLFPGKSEEGIFSRKSLWLHNLGTAVGAKTLARKIGRPDSEEMFLAGLLHDVGKIILEEYVHEEFMNAVENSHSQKIPLFMAEQKILGAHHGEVGKYLADHWKLPAILSEAIRWHHELENTKEFQEVAAIVHTANHLARTLKIGNSGDFSPLTIHSAAASMLHHYNINPEDLTDEIKWGVKECKAFLEMGQESEKDPKTTS